MTASWQEVLISFLMVSGSFLMLLSAIGLLRFPDVFCRGHAQNKSMTMGMMMLLTAVWISLGAEKVGAILVIAIMAQFATIPIAGHMVALISFRKNVPRYRQREIDDYRLMKPVVKKKVVKILCLLMLVGPLWAEEGLLDPPGGLTIRFFDGQPLLAWDPVDESGIYRVAVFGPVDKDGHKPLMAAVWVDVTRWHYGVDPYIPKAGTWLSTDPKALRAGVRYSWMVSAARADGRDKGKWTGDTFVIPAGKQASGPGEVLPKPTATFTPEPIEPDPTVTPTPKSDEFTEDAGSDEDSLTTIDFSQTDKMDTTVSPSIARANDLYKNKNYAAAADEFNKLVEEDNMNADAWEGLGNCYRSQFLKLEAVEAYEKALEIDPQRKALEAWIKQQRRF